MELWQQKHLKIINIYKDHFKVRTITKFVNNLCV